MPDAILAVIGVIVFDGEAIVIPIAVVGLQLFHLARYIVARIVDWAIFALHGRKQMATQLADYLRENRYPEPNEYEDSPADYLAGVADNDSLDVKIRLRAAVEAGALTTWRTLRERGIANRLESAYEDALKTHKRSFPVAETSREIK